MEVRAMLKRATGKVSAMIPNRPLERLDAARRILEAQAAAERAGKPLTRAEVLAMAKEAGIALPEAGEVPPGPGVLRPA